MDGDLIFTGAGVSPVFPWAEVLNGCGIWTRVNSICSRPVVSAQIVILNRERGLGTVDGWREVILLKLSKKCQLTDASGHDMATVQGNWAPSSVFGTFHLRIHISPSTSSLHLEFLLGLWDRFWLLIVTSRGLNDETNGTCVRQSSPESVPPIGIFLFSFLPVYRPNFCSIDKGRNGIFIAKYSCKEEKLISSM